MAFSKPGAQWYFVAATCYLSVIHAILFISGGKYFFIDPAQNKRIMSLFASVAHIAFAILTVGIGPIQFLSGVRTKWPLVHAWLGRAYSVGVIGGGVFGLKASFTANTLPEGHYYFLALSTYWLYTISRGLRAIWRKDVADHKRWMTRNFILSYAAPLIRFQIGLLESNGWTPKEALTVSSLASWVPTSIAAELWWRFNDRKMAVH